MPKQKTRLPLCTNQAVVGLTRLTGLSMRVEDGSGHAFTLTALSGLQCVALTSVAWVPPVEAWSNLRRLRLEGVSRRRAPDAAHLLEALAGSACAATLEMLAMPHNDLEDWTNLRALHRLRELTPSCLVTASFLEVATGLQCLVLSADNSLNTQGSQSSLRFMHGICLLSAGGEAVFEDLEVLSVQLSWAGLATLLPSLPVSAPNLKVLVWSTTAKESGADHRLQHELVPSEVAGLIVCASAIGAASRSFKSLFAHNVAVLEACQAEVHWTNDFSRTVWCCLFTELERTVVRSPVGGQVLWSTAD